MLLPMKAMSVASWKRKYVITGCLELWSEIKQIIIDIRSLRLLRRAKDVNFLLKTVHHGNDFWQPRPEVCSVKLLDFPRPWGGLVFQACSIKVVHHCATKPCSERSLKAAKTWGQFRNQSLKVKEYIVQCRVRSLVLNCGTKWEKKIGEGNFLL